MSQKTKPLAVVIIDAMELRRAGLAALIQPWAETLGIITKATSLADFSAGLLEEIQPQFIIYSIGGTSLNATQPQQGVRKINELCPDVPCAILSDRTETEEAIAAAQLGKQAFMPTCIEPRIALQAFAFVLGGGSYFPREALMQSVSIARRSFNGKLPIGVHAETGMLTRRQQEVLERLKLGRSNKHIGRDLDMQESTVKVHVRQIMRKLGAANRTQAALFADQASEPAGVSPQPGMLPPEMGATQLNATPSLGPLSEFRPSAE
jgi:DNA-binding NarL/FixJ family response regulator